MFYCCCGAVFPRACPDIRSGEVSISFCGVDQVSNICQWRPQSLQPLERQTRLPLQLGVQGNHVSTRPCRVWLHSRKGKTALNKSRFLVLCRVLFANHASSGTMAHVTVVNSGSVIVARKCLHAKNNSFRVYVEHRTFFAVTLNLHVFSAQFKTCYRDERFHGECGCAENK